MRRLPGPGGHRGENVDLCDVVDRMAAGIIDDPDHVPDPWRGPTKERTSYWAASADIVEFSKARGDGGGRMAGARDFVKDPVLIVFCPTCGAHPNRVCTSSDEHPLGRDPHHPARSARSRVMARDGSATPEDVVLAECNADRPRSGPPVASGLSEPRRHAREL